MSNMNNHKEMLFSLISTCILYFRLGTNLNIYKIEKYVEEAIKRMRRVKRINYIQVKPKQNGYDCVLSVTSIDDEDLNLKLGLR